MQRPAGRGFLSLAFLSVLPLCAQVPSNTSIVKRIYPSIGTTAPTRAGAQNQSTPTGNGIFYHGGPLMLGVTNVYFIWYGDWSVDPNAQTILQNLASSIGGSPYFAINTTYSDSNLTPVTNAVSFNGSTTDNYSQGHTLSDTGVLASVTAAITSKRLPSDTHGVYFVLTSPDVKESSGFISSYCGWHTDDYINGADIKYAFVGDAATQGLASCAWQTHSSPNNDPGADAMASVLTHELEESVTDPDYTGWYDNQGNESADKCAWTFGQTYNVANGSIANLNLGGHDFLIQRQWVNLKGGYCSLALPPTITGLSPGSGAAGSTVPVSIGGSNLTNATVQVSGSGVTATVTSSSPSQAGASLAISGSAAPGARTLSVTTVGGTSSTVPFTITSGSSTTLTSMNPSTGAQGSSVNVTLTGTNFTSQSGVRLGGAGASFSNVVVVSPTSITVTFTLSATAALGAHSVYVTSPSGNSNTLNFTVTAPQASPTLSSMSPNTAVQGTSVNVTLTGTNFTSGASVTVSGSGVTTSKVIVVSSTQITATLTVATSAAPGQYSIGVTTAGGSSTPVSFSVSAASLAPTLVSINPPFGSAGASVNVTLTGTNFTAQSGIRLAGMGASFSNVVVVNSTSITATFTLKSNVAPGPHNVYVVTAAGSSNILPFTVN